MAIVMYSANQDMIKCVSQNYGNPALHSLLINLAIEGGVIKAVVEMSLIFQTSYCRQPYAGMRGHQCMNLRFKITYF